MTLPVVAMESHAFTTAATTASWSLKFSTGATLTVSAVGRVSVPWQLVGEAIQKGFIITDQNAVRYPPRSGDMCPPSPLTTVVYAAAPAAQLAPVGYEAAAAANPQMYGNAPSANPNAPKTLAEVAPTGPQATRMWQPSQDPRPYAVVNLPDGTTMNAYYPGSNIIQIPEQHIAYFKGLGWTLLREWM